MNLFINDNFINTLDDKVDIVQLIRQIAEDFDTPQSEVLGIIEHDCGDTEDDIVDGVDHSVISDGTLYCKGDMVKTVFGCLYDEDYNAIVNRVCDVLENPPSPTVRLDVNGFIIPTVSEEVAFTAPTQPAVPEVEEFGEEVGAGGTSSLAHLIVNRLPTLYFNGQEVKVRQGARGNILFNVAQLYSAVYGINHHPDYLIPLVIRRRVDLEESQVLIESGELFLGAYALRSLHTDLACTVEFTSMVSIVVQSYSDEVYSPNSVRDSVHFNVFGHVM